MDSASPLDAAILLELTITSLGGIYRGMLNNTTDWAERLAYASSLCNLCVSVVY